MITWMTMNICIGDIIFKEQDRRRGKKNYTFYMCVVCVCILNIFLITEGRHRVHKNIKTTSIILKSHLYR